MFAFVLRAASLPMEPSCPVLTVACGRRHLDIWKHRRGKRLSATWLLKGQSPFISYDCLSVLCREIKQTQRWKVGGNLQDQKAMVTLAGLKGIKPKTAPECSRSPSGFISPHLSPTPPTRTCCYYFLSPVFWSTSLSASIWGKRRVFTTQEFPRARLILCHTTPENQHSMGGAGAMRKCPVYRYSALLKHRRPFLSTSQVWKHLPAVPALWQFEAGKSLELSSLASWLRSSLKK